MSYVTHVDDGKKIEIYYESIGMGEPIVFHHGNGNCCKDWYTLGYVDALARDYQLILIDSRGYGKSTKLYEPEAYTLRSRANDTIAVLDQLQIEKAHCLGGSIGAAMCFILARFYPNRFLSYIFATPYFALFDDTIKQALLQSSAHYLAKLEELLGCRLDNEIIRQTFLANNADAVWAANSSEWFNYVDYIQYIKAPSLIYVGAKEPSISELSILAQQLSDCQFKIIPELDHKDIYWRGDLVAPIIKDFIVSL